MELGLLRQQVCESATRFDARRLDGDGAAAALREWSAIAHAADAACSMAAARIAECGPPSSAGATDASDFVAKATGTTSVRAKECIKTGTGMHVHEKTRRMATSGGLSAEQAAAITDALALDPDAEDDLLASAERDSVGALRDECSKRKVAKSDLATNEKRIHANRRVRRYRDAEGAEHLHAVGTKATMTRLDAALRRLTDERFARARQEAAREPLEAYAYDALIALADETAGGAKERMRYLGLLRLDFEALIRGTVESDETCEIAGLGPISVETARELLGESVLKLVITKGVDVLNVTHLGRGPSMAQKIAWLWQRPLCTREGCGRRGRLEFDHSDGFEFRTTRHTRVDELEPLCDPDHDLKTLHGWALVEGSGIRPMVPPDDPRHPRYKPPP